MLSMPQHSRVQIQFIPKVDLAYSWWAAQPGPQASDMWSQNGPPHWKQPSGVELKALGAIPIHAFRGRCIYTHDLPVVHAIARFCADCAAAAKRMAMAMQKGKFIDQCVGQGGRGFMNVAAGKATRKGIGTEPAQPT